MCKRHNGARSHNHYCCGKPISVTYSECASVSLVTQHSLHVRYTVICGLSASATIFHVISYMARLKGQKLFNIKHVLLFCLQSFSDTFLILRRIQRDIIINVRRYSSEVPVILGRFSWYLNILYGFSEKNSQMLIFIKILSTRVESFMRKDNQTEGQTDGQTNRQTWQS